MFGLSSVSNYQISAISSMIYTYWKTRRTLHSYARYFMPDRSLWICIENSGAGFHFRKELRVVFLWVCNKDIGLSLPDTALGVGGYHLYNLRIDPIDKTIVIRGILAKWFLLFWLLWAKNKLNAYWNSWTCRHTEPTARRTLPGCCYVLNASTRNVTDQNVIHLITSGYCWSSLKKWYAVKRNGMRFEIYEVRAGLRSHSTTGIYFQPPTLLIVVSESFQWLPVITISRLLISHTSNNNKTLHMENIVYHLLRLEIWKISINNKVVLFIDTKRKCCFISYEGRWYSKGHNKSCDLLLELIVMFTIRINMGTTVMIRAGLCPHVWRSP